MDFSSHNIPYDNNQCRQSLCIDWQQKMEMSYDISWHNPSYGGIPGFEAFAFLKGFN